MRPSIFPAQATPITPVSSVSLRLSRDDHDFQERLIEMRLFCQVNSRGRWNWSCPMSGDAARFEFENGLDALHFRMRFDG